MDVCSLCTRHEEMTANHVELLPLWGLQSNETNQTCVSSLQIGYLCFNAPVSSYVKKKYNNSTSLN